MNETQFSPLPIGERYKYLGIKQGLTNDHASMKRCVKEKFLERLKLILKSELYAKAQITAINTWAIPVVSHTFGVLQWTHTDLQTLDTKIRTTLTKYRRHHPNSSYNRLYIPRKMGGRGLMNLEMMHDSQVKKLYNFFKNVRNPLHEAIVKIDNISPLKLSQEQAPEVSKTIK